MVSGFRGYVNRYGHPHRETLERLSRSGARIFRTDRDGAITVETDGTRIRVTPALTAEAKGQKRRAR